MNSRIILAVRILAMPAICTGVLALLDGMLPTSIVDEAVVKSKEVWHSRGTTYNIQAQGKFTYSESVSREFYSSTQEGMKLRISLTQIFKEWKKAEVIKDGHVVFTGHGNDIYWLPAVGALLVLPCLCYRNAAKWFNTKGLIIFGVIDLAGVILFLRLIMVWFGFVDNM